MIIWSKIWSRYWRTDADCRTNGIWSRFQSFQIWFRISPSPCTTLNSVKLPKRWIDLELRHCTQYIHSVHSTYITQPLHYSQSVEILIFTNTSFVNLHRWEIGRYLSRESCPCLSKNGTFVTIFGNNWPPSTEQIPPMRAGFIMTHLLTRFKGKRDTSILKELENK